MGMFQHSQGCFYMDWLLHVKLTYGNVFGKCGDYYLSIVLIWRWPPHTWLTAHELMSLTFVLLVREGSVLLNKSHSMWVKQFKLSLGLNGFLFQNYYLRGFWEVVEQLRAFVAFAKVLDLIPSIHVMTLTMCNASSGAQSPSSAFLSYQACGEHIYMHATHSYI